MLNHITPEAAEFFGMLLGDGMLESYKQHRVYILKFTGNSLTDEPYYRMHVSKIITKLLMKSPTTRVRSGENTMDCYLYSKEIVDALILRFNFPAHKEDIKISDIERVLNQEKHKYICFLRGFFDTDGSIFKKYGNYAQIGFRNGNIEILNYIFSALKRMDFNPSFEKSNGNVFIHRQKEVVKFFKLIGSSNPKHIVRYLHWKNNGYIPSIDDLIRMTLLDKFDSPLPFLDK